MFAAERTDAIENARLAGEYSDSNYQRYLDRLAQYNTDRSFGYGVLSDVLDRSFQREQWQNALKQQEYQKDRDALADERYADETAYNRKLDAWNQEQSERQDSYNRDLAAAQLLYEGTGDASALGRLYGYTPEQIQALNDWYARQQGQYAPQSRPVFGGAGSSYDNGKLTGENVKELQTYLRNNGADIAVDGFWGPASQAAAGGMTADEMWKEYHTALAEEASPGSTTMWDLTEGRNIKLSEDGEAFKRKLTSIPGLTNENKEAMIEEACGNMELNPDDTRLLLKYFGLLQEEN